MGEVTDAILNGELCQGCGEALDGGSGYPRWCHRCRPRQAQKIPKSQRYRTRRISDAFSEFSRLVTAAGLEPRDCGDGHFQIRGGAKIVNYYPESSRGRVIFVCGESGSIRGDKATIGEAVRLAKGDAANSAMHDSRLLALATENRQLRGEIDSLQATIADLKRGEPVAQAVAPWENMQPQSKGPVRGFFARLMDRFSL